MQNYIAMRNLNCAIRMIDHHLNRAFQITHRKVILHTYGPKYRHSNDNSNCAFLLSCENSHKNIGTAHARKLFPIDLPFCAGCWCGLGTAQDDDVFLPAVEV